MIQGCQRGIGHLCESDVPGVVRSQRSSQLPHPITDRLERTQLDPHLTQILKRHRSTVGGDVASALFPLITDDGFAGDVELLYVALKYNLAIRRIPVRLLRTGSTTVSVVGHSLPMLRRIAGLRRRWASSEYDSEVLRHIASQRYWLHRNHD